MGARKRRDQRASTSEEEDWTALLDQYMLPVDATGNPDAVQLDDDDDVPWREALRTAARALQTGSNGTVSRRADRRDALPTDAPVHPLTQLTTPSRTARIGDRVTINSLAGVRGTVLEVSGALAMVETRATRVRVKLSELTVIAVGADPQRRPGPPNLIFQAELDGHQTVKVGTQTGRHRQRWYGLDLHGLTLMDALERLDDFLFASWEEGRETVAVIHGKGSGVLRKHVRTLLAGHPAVRHIHAALPNSGGDGVTIVTLFAPRNGQRQG